MKMLMMSLVVLAGSAHAQQFQYSFSGFITQSDIPAAFRVGDPYRLTFDLNLASVDTSGSAGTAIFMNAVTNLTFALGPSASGSYGTGTMSGSQFLQLSQTDHGDHINFYASSNYLLNPADLTFPAADGHPFTEVGFNLYSSRADVFDFVFGARQTLGSTLPAIVLAPFDNMADVYLVFDGRNSRIDGNISSITASAIPEPSTYVLFAGLSAMLVAVGGKLRRRARR